MDRLTLTRPDDWHIHLRDGAALERTVPDAARVFGRVLAMPNLAPPVVDTAQALAYRARAEAACPAGRRLEVLPTLYLTDHTRPEEIAAARAAGVVAAKLYPAGATTNADSGVTDLARVDDALAALAEEGLVLAVHGEVTDPDVDVFDRERVFLERRLAPLVGRFPTLRVVLEHVTTRAAVAFVRAAPERVGATITAHHLHLDRNDLLAGGLRPHHYCLPVVKRAADRRALIEAATSGHPRFFLGTDSAPHARAAKEAPCGCAGIYTAHAALELYAEAFDAAGALARLEAFASFHGADFYRLARNRDAVTLTRSAWRVPESLAFGDAELVPHRAGQEVAWRIVGDA